MQNRQDFKQTFIQYVILHVITSLDDINVRDTLINFMKNISNTPFVVEFQSEKTKNCWVFFLAKTGCITYFNPSTLRKHTYLSAEMIERLISSECFHSFHTQMGASSRKNNHLLYLRTKSYLFDVINSTTTSIQNDTMQIGLSRQVI